MALIRKHHFHLGSSNPEAFIEHLLYVKEREPTAVEPFMLQALCKLGAFTHLSYIGLKEAASIFKDILDLCCPV